MDLRLFFSPVPEDVYADISNQSSFYKNIKVYQELFPDYKDADIAIIGISEERSGEHLEGMGSAANTLRKKLYPLMKGTGAYKIVDLGNIGETVDLDQTYGRLQEIAHACIENNVLPIFIGGSHDMDWPQYLAYEDMEKLVSVLNIDAFLDMEDQNSANNKSHIHKILMHQPNYLFNYSHLAYQSYLIDPKAVSVLEKLYFEAYRIGTLRHDIKEMEPIIRNADLLSFDISAIKSSDAPGTGNPQPFGLTGEEACQLCWYAGLNDKLSSAGFYEYNPAHDDSTGKTAAVVATMIWYFIEGYYHRKESRDFRSNDYIKYVVSMPAEPETLVFYKSNQSERWWMEVPLPSGKSRYDRNCIVPCSYSDYKTANDGELPERWINMHTKLF